jgi:hypothetical protein
VIIGLPLASAVAGAVIVLVLGGCSTSAATPEGTPTPAVPVGSTSASASASPTAVSSQIASTGTAEEEILAEYRRLWRQVIPAAAAAKPADRRALLEPVLMDPALSEHLAWLIKLDRAGQKSVGRSEPLAEVIQRQGDTAVVKGCLDSSNVATVEVESGTYVGRGLPHEIVVVTFERADDGKWRVSGWKFPKDPRC